MIHLHVGTVLTTTSRSDSESSADSDPLIGQLIDGRYRVLRQLGDGGMGIVYKVEHSYLNKFFALKVMRPTRDTVDRQRFEQEARLASRIRHKNVVEISDYGILPSGQPYFVMEFLRGHTLGDAIFEGRIDPMVACHIAAQIASGLQAVHKQNVVHRDLKPDNIFIIDPDEHEAEASTIHDGSDSGDVHFIKIMDFGIAKSVDKNLTGTGMTLGTPEYMSPEQATGEKIDWRSDQYSLGCILYEMLTGELPFIGKSAFETMQKHLTEPPIPPRRRRQDGEAYIPEALEKIVLCMMMKRPAQRYLSMREVEQALREVVAGMRHTAPNPMPILPSPSRDNAKTQLNALLSSQPIAPVEPSHKNSNPPRETARKIRASDEKTRLMLPAVPAAAPTPSPSQTAKTLLMIGSSEGHAQTPTPKLLEKLRIRISSAPELSIARKWSFSSALRRLLRRCLHFLRRLRSTA